MQILYAKTLSSADGDQWSHRVAGTDRRRDGEVLIVTGKFTGTRSATFLLPEQRKEQGQLQ